MYMKYQNITLYNSTRQEYRAFNSRQNITCNHMVTINNLKALKMALFVNIPYLYVHVTTDATIHYAVHRYCQHNEKFIGQD